MFGDEQRLLREAERRADHDVMGAATTASPPASAPASWRVNEIVAARLGL